MWQQRSVNKIIADKRLQWWYQRSTYHMIAHDSLKKCDYFKGFINVFDKQHSDCKSSLTLCLLHWSIATTVMAMRCLTITLLKIPFGVRHWKISQIGQHSFNILQKENGSPFYKYGVLTKQHFCCHVQSPAVIDHGLLCQWCQLLMAASQACQLANQTVAMTSSREQVHRAAVKQTVQLPHNSMNCPSELQQFKDNYTVLAALTLYILSLYLPKNVFVHLRTRSSADA